MPQHKFRVKAAGSYGKRGDLVALNTAELTERQKVMLEPYAEPQVTVVSTKPAIDLKDKDAVVAELKRLNIDHDARKGLDDLVAMLPKA